MSNTENSETTPMLTEEKANFLLDDIVANNLVVKNSEDEVANLTTTETLSVIFGDRAQLVAHLMFLAMASAHEVGTLSATPLSDRGDILISALRKVHQPEQFGDCVEDGDHYPCKSARAMNIVTGSDPHARSLDDELASLVSDSGA